MHRGYQTGLHKYLGHEVEAAAGVLVVPHEARLEVRHVGKSPHDFGALLVHCLKHVLQNSTWKQSNEQKQQLVLALYGQLYITAFLNKKNLLK